MLAWAFRPRAPPSAQLPEGSIAIQMMENPLFSLKSVIATCKSFHFWLIHISVAILCALLLLYLLSWVNASRGDQVQEKQQEKNEALKACRDCLLELEEVRNLMSILGSHLGRPPDTDSSCQRSDQDLPSEACTKGLEVARGICPVPVKEAVPLVSPVASPAPPTLCPLPLASTCSTDQHDLEGMPLGTEVTSQCPENTFLLSPIPATSASCSACPTKSLSWQRVTSQALFFPSLSQPESQQEHPSSHPPLASFWEDPTDKQVETGSLSFVHHEVQKLLEMLLTKKAQLKVWEEKEKKGPFSNRKSMDSHLNSLGNMWKSLGAEQDTMTSLPFWSTKGKQEPVPGAQQSSHLKFLGDHLQQRWSQLFWGLPSLHSESLVATFWASKGSFSLEPISMAFNGLCNSIPVPVPHQPGTSSGLSQAPALPPPEAQTQPFNGHLTQSQPPPPAQIQTQTHLVSSPTIRPPSSVSQMRTSGVSCPTPQNKAQVFVPIEIQHLEPPSLKKQLQRVKASRSVTGTTQGGFRHPTPNLPQGSGASHGHRSVSIPHREWNSPHHQKQHLQKRIFKDKQQDGPDFRVQVSLKLMQAQGQCPGVSRAQDSQKMEPSIQRRSHMKNQPGQDLSRGLRLCVGMTLKGPTRGPANFAVEFLEMNYNKSERHGKPPKSDPGTCLHRDPNKKPLEALLQAHLGRKLEQMTQGLIPVRVRRSWLTASHTFPILHTHRETQASLKSRRHYVNTSCELSFLDPPVRQVLESHIIRFRVGRNWGLPFQAIGPLKLKQREAQYLPLPPSHSSPPDVCVSGVHSKSNFTKVLEKPPQPLSKENVITTESFLTGAGPLPTTSPEVEEIQKAMGGTPSGYGHGPSEAPLTGQQNRPPSQSLTLGLMGKTQQTGAVVEVEERSRGSKPSSAVAKNEPQEGRKAQNSGDPRHRASVLEGNLGSQLSGTNEAREEVQAEEAPPWEVTVAPGELASHRTLNMSMRGSGCPGPHKICSPPTKSVARDSEELFRKTMISTKMEPQGKADSENQLQGWATGVVLPDNHTEVLLQDYATGLLFTNSGTSMLLQDPQPDVLLAADILAAHSSLTRSPRESSSVDAPAAQVPHDLIWNAHSSQGQQVPRVSKVKCPCESQSKMSLPPDKREDDKRPSPGEHKEGQAVVTAVRQILVEKLGLHQELHAKESHQHKTQFQAPVGGFSSYHKALSSPQQRRVMEDMAYTHQIMPNGHKNIPNKSGLTRDRISKWAFSPTKPGCPGRPSQHGLKVAEVSDHLHRYPTCCPSSGQPGCAFDASSGPSHHTPTGLHSTFSLYAPQRQSSMPVQLKGLESLDCRPFIDQWAKAICSPSSGMCASSSWRHGLHVSITSPQPGSSLSSPSGLGSLSSDVTAP
ncbi:spermatogenesis-associated protein 31E1-like [Saccopteryx bilineata]|uniref:spermatogenesis-associated protein 31E1-like n=1 Tax=Saccopteryx bilineata TaxID=59482 RepID=UPI00338D379F